MRKAAEFLQKNVYEIMERWEEVVRSRISASEDTNEIALYDHLPQLINDIADIMIRYHDDVSQDITDEPRYGEILDNSALHGRHRATSLSYTSGQIIHEYILFHRTISDILLQNGLLDIRVSNLLKYVIETCVLKSVDSFTEALQEMQEKLIGTLAHDIRNPLTVALLATEMMDEDTSGEQFIRLKNSAIRSIRKSLNLCEGLMDSITVKAGEGMMLHFEEKDVVKDINWIYKEASDIYAQEIVLNCESANIFGVVDSIGIRRMLENLITNAIKYGDTKMPVTIDLKEDQEHVILSVHNHGNPIDTEKQRDIFKFLNKSDYNPSGLLQSWGMGLTLVKMIASAHGGSVELQSNEVEGTTFKVTIQKYSTDVGKKRSKLKMFAN